MTRATAPQAFLSTAEVAEELGCSADLVHRAIDRGDLVALKYGRLVRVKRTDLDAFVTAHMTKAGVRRRLRSTA